MWNYAGKVVTTATVKKKSRWKIAFTHSEPKWLELDIFLTSPHSPAFRWRCFRLTYSCLGRSTLPWTFCFVRCCRNFHSPQNRTIQEEWNLLLCAVTPVIKICKNPQFLLFHILHCCQSKDRLTLLSSVVINTTQCLMSWSWLVKNIGQLRSNWVFFLEWG